MRTELKNKIETSIGLIQAWEPQKDGYYLAFSGGKDSVVLYDLTMKSEVHFDAHYCVSPIDPPEIYRFIKENYPDVSWDFHAKGFWKKVVSKGLPTRRSRWCCELIKESGGLHRYTLVGNRAEESHKRSLQNCFGQQTTKDIFFVRPLIAWTWEDIWEYIGENSLSYCSLYDEGFERLGCILCPMASVKNRRRELERFPKVSSIWRRTCDRLVARRLLQGKDRFKTGQELWDWWFSQ